jgi:hypothetical protein
MHYYPSGAHFRPKKFFWPETLAGRLLLRHASPQARIVLNPRKQKETLVLHEAELPGNIDALIRKAIAGENNIKVIAYTVIPVTETGLRRISELVLEKYSKSDLLPTVAMILKELALNAAKANFKRILFAMRRLDLENDADYERGMRDFKAAISEEWAIEYGRRSKQLNRRVEILFSYNAERLLINVVNNFPLSQKEEIRVRQKLAAAMQYEDIGDFFANCGDETEGAGLGLVLIMTALKSYGIDPHAFTIYVNAKDQTVASLEVPLSSSYQIRRHRLPHITQQEKT